MDKTETDLLVKMVEEIFTLALQVLNAGETVDEHHQVDIGSASHSCTFT